MDDFRFLSKIALLKPKIIIDYNRTAFIDSTLGIRVTIDTNICASTDISNFWNAQDIIDKEVVNKNVSIVEVKYEQIFPKHLYNVLHALGSEQEKFSKYVAARLCF